MPFLPVSTTIQPGRDFKIVGASIACILSCHLNGKKQDATFEKSLKYSHKLRIQITNCIFTYGSIYYTCYLFNNGRGVYLPARQKSQFCLRLHHGKQKQLNTLVALDEGIMLQETVFTLGRTKTCSNCFYPSQRKKVPTTILFATVGGHEAIPAASRRICVAVAEETPCFTFLGRFCLKFYTKYILPWSTFTLADQNPKGKSSQCTGQTRTLSSLQRVSV